MLFLCGILKWLANYLYKIWVINKIPGLPMTPFLGNVNHFLKKAGFLNGFLTCTKPFMDKPYCRLWIGTQPWISIHKSDKLNVILDSSVNIKKSFDYTLMKNWLGTGILTSTGDKWTHRRKLMNPTFSQAMLKEFFDVMNEQCDILVECINKQVAENDTFELMPYAGRMTLDVICETAMGKSVNAQLNRNSSFVEATENIARVLTHRMKSPWLWPNIVFFNTKYGKLHNECLDVLHGFANNIIHERIAEYKETGESGNMKRRMALLDNLVKINYEDPIEMPVDGVQEEVNTFMFAGRDTTSATIVWACYSLARNVEAQNKLFDEVKSVIGDSTRQFTFDEINSMKYLDCVIKETLRLFPAAPLIVRELVEDIYLDDYRVPKGTSVLLFLYQIHRDERHFKDANAFRPERFSDGSLDHIPEYAYVPFSAGKRNCIGQKFGLLESKLAVANLIRHFSFECDQTLNDVEPDAEMILRTANPIIFRVKQRNATD